MAGVEFGETVMYMKRRGAKFEKIKLKNAPGVFVGCRAKSNELMVVDEDGIHHVRTVKRLPEEERWDKRRGSREMG